MLSETRSARRALLILAAPVVFELGQFATCAPDQPLGVPGYPPLYFLPDPGVVRQDLVYRVQEALFARGFDPGVIDGKTGAKTRAAIRDYATWAGQSVSEDITPELLIELQQRP